MLIHQYCQCYNPANVPYITKASVEKFKVGLADVATRLRTSTNHYLPHNSTRIPDDFPPALGVVAFHQAIYARTYTVALTFYYSRSDCPDKLTIFSHVLRHGALIFMLKFRLFFSCYGPSETVTVTVSQHVNRKSGSNYLGPFLELTSCTHQSANTTAVKL